MNLVARFWQKSERPRIDLTAISQKFAPPESIASMEWPSGVRRGSSKLLHARLLYGLGASYLGVAAEAVVLKACDLIVKPAAAKDYTRIRSKRDAVRLVNDIARCQRKNATRLYRMFSMSP